MAGIAAGILVIWVGAVALIARWGLGRDRVARALGEETASQVEFQGFRYVYFPRPGCVAEGVTFRRNGSSGEVPLITARKITLDSSFMGLLRRHVSVLEAEGVQVTPGGKGWPTSSSSSTTEVDHLIVRNSVLQVERGDGSSPLRFAVHELTIDDLGDGTEMKFHVALSNAIPPGEIVASGKFGPWSQQDRGATMISGSYTFRHADLSAIDGIGGLLSSDGKFHGPLNRLAVEGSTDTPDFEVIRTRKKFPLTTRFQAEVNGTNGDLVLKKVQARLEKTEITGTGSVKPQEPGGPRTAVLDAVAQQGRIQDILFPFVHAPKSPLNGATNFRAHLTLPGGPEPFLKRVALKGEFGVNDANFTSPVTQNKVNKASEEARGHPDKDDPENVVSDLKGGVDLKNGVATFSQLSFSLPGAKADVHGTFNVVNERINMHGVVQLQAKLSNTTSGFKSFLIKVLNPFIQKDKPREPLPVAVSGTYSHPQFSVSITSKKKPMPGGE